MFRFSHAPFSPTNYSVFVTTQFYKKKRILQYMVFVAFIYSSSSTILDSWHTVDSSIFCFRFPLGVYPEILSEAPLGIPTGVQSEIPSKIFLWVNPVVQSGDFKKNFWRTARKNCWRIFQKNLLDCWRIPIKKTRERFRYGSPKEI